MSIGKSIRPDSSKPQFIRPIVTKTYFEQFRNKNLKGRYERLSIKKATSPTELAGDTSSKNDRKVVAKKLSSMNPIEEWKDYFDK